MSSGFCFLSPRPRAILVLVGLIALGPACGAGGVSASLTPAEKARKVLQQPCNLQINALTLTDAVNQLREQTGLPFVLDEVSIPPALLIPLLGGGLGAQSPARPQVVGEFHRISLGEAVRRLLQRHGLTYALAGSNLWITSPARAAALQHEQVVSLDAEETPLGDLLGRLTRQTGANIVLDPRQGNLGKTKMTLHLSDVMLATAVELLADEAGLRLVRLDEVLYLTSEERAERLLKSRKANQPSQDWQVFIDEKGGIHLKGGGALPATWQTPNLGLPGNLGMLGFVGTGVQGMLGGGQHAPPTPLTPPLPQKPAERKPESSRPPEARPGPEKPAAPASPAPKKPDREVRRLPVRRDERVSAGRSLAAFPANAYAEANVFACQPLLSRPEACGRCTRAARLPVPSWS